MTQRRRWIGQLIVWFIKLNYYLPTNLNNWLSLISSRIAMRLNTQASRAIRDNISLCFPEYSKHERSNLVRQFLIQNSRMSKECSLAWLGDKSDIDAMIDKVTNKKLITHFQQANKPIIIAVPHIGNWEYLWHWIQFNYSAIGMYSPSKYESVSKLILNSRKRFGGQACSSDIGGMMKLFKGLKQNKIMMILPDQAPNPKSGIYSSFFGYPAYTMTLLHRLIRKTDAQLLFGSSIRNKKGKFDLYFERAEFDDQMSDLHQFNEGLNGQIETIIRRNPDQYLWSYKRFKRQPKGQGIYTY
ncbi:MAG: lysophospholipid acyltransferase family protein [Kangiellaceae bacterium]|nr:lysophospholipid acyltransferase family protein [Kangiellaceae bacterium]